MFEARVREDKQASRQDGNIMLVLIVIRENYLGT
jgi:hypothetical protein